MSHVTRKSEGIINLNLVTKRQTYNIVSAYANSKTVTRRPKTDFGQFVAVLQRSLSWPET